MKTKLTVLASLLAAAGVMGTAQAQDKVVIGFATDMSSLYSDVDGKNGALAAQMAIDDFGGKVLGKPIELVTADHQNKADIAAAKVREWIDTQKASMILGGTNSSAGLAVNAITKEKNVLYLVNGAGSTAFTNEQCAPYTIHYAYDTMALARGTGSAVVAEGGKSWFFLTADYAFGHALEKDTAATVKAAGGEVKGNVRHPLNASDFSSFLLQAQTSGAKVLGMANAGGDTINTIKAANEFGITGSMKLAGLLLFLTDIHSMGLESTKGLQFTTSWYWDQDEASRAWAQKFYEKAKRMPTSIHAANYSAVMNYLKAVEEAGTLETEKVNAVLRGKELSDFYAKGTIRPDGRYAHDMYLVEVKKPAESKREWDYLKVVKTLPASEVFFKKEETKCALWK
ncbi:ABC transporter substrate-binding protein [Comamonadaceae bacterium OH2310_COT-174]|uniref:ABC transporter permease n=1 Tax=Vandammella animalimorsus TaxID=2029117 RepID=A0A2A2ACN0_9BURK|nr:ABC transporter substrate-binding protein [Vandammella animalimorsus]PAT35553.1 ABC transporter permease [Vandammella animalimorsus]RRD68518.1 ABC transporter substrate-binding protein [Comamonadaceae bacterium OH2310_COT-174]